MFLSLFVIWVLNCPYEIIDGRENEEVENGINDATFDIHMWQNWAKIKKHPHCAKSFIVQSSADIEDQYQSNNAKKYIWESGSKFILAKYRHTYTLYPEKERWFLPEWFKIDLVLKIVSCDHHFSRGLCEIDLIPIKQMHIAKEWQQYQCSNSND